MKPLLLILLLSTLAFGQTEISDQNIQKCFKNTTKTPADFDRCTSYEFERVRNLKRLRELRVLNGKPADSPCDKPGNDLKCFDETMADLRASTERLHELGGSPTTYIPTYRHYPYYRPYYYRDFYPSYRYRYLYPRTFFPLIRPWRR